MTESANRPPGGELRWLLQDYVASGRLNLASGDILSSQMLLFSNGICFAGETAELFDLLGRVETEMVNMVPRGDALDP
jgi:hypothetical protein